MGPLTQSLCAILAELVDLLSAHGERHWTDWLQSDLTRIRAADFGGIEHLLSAYGGAGSFNDLILHPANGHTMDASDIDQINRRLQTLRSQTWHAANQVRRAAVAE